MSKSLSIVIPVYNEEKRIFKTFSALENFSFADKFTKIEFIFVSDGSTDKTETLINNFKSVGGVKLISYSPNRGKGFAVKTGMLAATGDYALFLDADMSTGFEELEKFLPHINGGGDVIIGSRKMPGAVVMKHQPWHRKKMGEAYTYLANFITGVGISDFTCGFKCFSKKASVKIFQKSKVDRWSYDAEILFLATKAGYNIKEVGVKWRDDENTRVRLGSDIVRSFLDLIKIRIHGS